MSSHTHASETGNAGTTATGTIAFVKGHGTENDFVIPTDAGAALDLTESLVAALCDRRAGVGGDGLLRVARAGALVEAGVLDALPHAGRPDEVHADDWFMDYRNADGSIAEMCGNGVRVFAHHLFASGLTEEMSALRVGTRAGVKIVSLDDVAGNRATVSVDMGAPVVLGAATAFLGAGRYAGVGVDMGNPHLACVLPGLDPDGLARLDLAGVPEVGAEMFPAGVNLEVVTPLAQSGAIHMRVIERGVGETRSCGTGTVAAAVAALADAGRGTGTVDVHVPGGTVTVEVNEETSILTGPSVLVARGEIDVSALLV
ncbi:diaminopimelate epimerase [Corynebacterium xerosis]|uniref:diaminopimelate epimerase n=1 Tax=Corynebacterium xerosis TaxID=1725 RepID=UPI0007673CC5|nr:diaminopimelate epimerase [Corynebacterium xerosis]SQB95549.1 diaminopimelate epimerase [Clostridium paraputrificum]